MDRLESMSILLTAVETGSLSAAARRHGTSLASVSRKVSELEAYLKTRLLNRSSRQLTLTDAGQSYVDACKRILEDVGEAERTAAGEFRTPKGELIITTPVAFGRIHILPIVTEFLKAFPDIDIRMVMTDRVVNLLEDHVDVAVRIGALPDSSLIASHVGSIRRIVCGSPAYFAERGTPKSPDELRAHDCISYEWSMSLGDWKFAIGKSTMSVAVHSRLIVNTAEAAFDAAIAGLGITRGLSYQIADAVRAGMIAVVLEAFEEAPWPVNLVYAGQRFLPLKLRAFLDFAVPRLKAEIG